MVSITPVGEDGQALGHRLDPVVHAVEETGALDVVDPLRLRRLLTLP